MSEKKLTLADRENKIELSPREVEVNDEMRAMGAIMKEASLQAAKEKAELGRSETAVIAEFSEKFEKLSEEMIRLQKRARVVNSGLPVRIHDREDLQDILDREPMNDWEREFHRLNDIAHTATAVMGARASADKGFDYNPRELKSVQKLNRHIELVAGDAGDWFTNEPTGGGEAGGNWVPVGYSVTMLDFKRLASRVFGSLPFRVLPNREGQHNVPTKSSPSNWRLLDNQGQSAPTSRDVFGGNFTTDYVPLLPKRHQGATAFDAAYGEDSIIDQFQAHTQELVAGGPQILDSCVINGQPEGGAMDGSNGNGFDNGYGMGFRYYCHTGTTGLPIYPADGQGGNVDAGAAGDILTALEDGRALMGKWGVMPEELGYYLPPGPYLRLLQTGGSNTKQTGLTMISQLGPNATLVTGQVADLYGSPVFVSEMHLKNLNAGNGGAATPGQTTSAEIANRMAWVAGARRSLQTEVHRVPGNDSWTVYAFMRTHIGPVVERANDYEGGFAGSYTPENVHTVMLYNVALA